MGRGRKRAFGLWLALVVAAVSAVWAATWNTAFEASPPNSESVGLAAQRIRELKAEVRDRLEAEHDFGNTGNVSTDTGRHLAGSARIFVQSSPPAVDGTTSAACLAEADTAGQRYCEAGRAWLDSDDNRLYVSTDAGADGDADAWQPIKIDAADVATGVIAPARLDATATPTANKIPIADGTGKLNSGWITFPAGAPVKICDVGPATAVECTALNSSLYKSYEVVISGDILSSSNGGLGAQTDSSGGASYDGGSFDYDNSSGSGASFINIVGNSVGTGSFFVKVQVYAGSSATYPMFLTQGVVKSAFGNVGGAFFGLRNSLAEINAFRVAPVGAFTANIRMQVYGQP